MTSLAELPNSLAETKTDYYWQLIHAVRKVQNNPGIYMNTITNMIFQFYHCEVPVEEAEKYLLVFVNKIKNAEGNVA